MVGESLLVRTAAVAVAASIVYVGVYATNGETEIDLGAVATVLTASGSGVAAVPVNYSVTTLEGISPDRVTSEAAPFNNGKPALPMGRFPTVSGWPVPRGVIPFAVTV